MKTRKLTTGEKGWIGMVLYVIVVDSVAFRRQLKGVNDETMSLSWGRWLQAPGSRAATGLAWAILSFHLFLSTPLPGGKTLKKAVSRTVKNGKVDHGTVISDYEYQP